MSLLVCLQVCNLGFEPAVSLLPRDYKAADVKLSPQTGHSPDSMNSVADAVATNTDQQVSSGVQPDRHPAAGQQSQQLLINNNEGTKDRSAVGFEQLVGNSAGSAAVAVPTDHAEWSRSGSSFGLVNALKAELQQLQDSYLVLQEAYWAQKERLLALELEAGQLRSTSEEATAAAAQVRAA